jgi:hypothetical protein
MTPELFHPGHTPRKCRHLADKSLRTPVFDSTTGDVQGYLCPRCSSFVSTESTRRGRNNRSRGNAIERWVCNLLGIKRVGMYGAAEDGGAADDPWVVQVKSGGYFTERYWTELKRLTVQGQQTALLVVTDTPGAGHRRRAYVVMDIEDFIALHVGQKEAA